MKTKLFIVAAAFVTLAVLFAFQSYAKRPDGGSTIPAMETIEGASGSLEPTYASTKPSADTTKPNFEIYRPVRNLEPMPLYDRSRQGYKPNTPGNFNPNEPVSVRKSK